MVYSSFAAISDDILCFFPSKIYLCNSSDLFTLHENGTLTLSGPLDYETSVVHNLTMVASDTKHSTRGHLVVNVLNVNDNAPMCPLGGCVSFIFRFPSFVWQLFQVIFKIECLPFMTLHANGCLGSFVTVQPRRS